MRLVTLDTGLHMSLGVQGLLSVWSHEPNNANERLELDDGVSIARYYSFDHTLSPPPKTGTVTPSLEVDCTYPPSFSS